MRVILQWSSSVAMIMASVRVFLVRMIVTMRVLLVAMAVAIAVPVTAISGVGTVIGQLAGMVTFAGEEECQAGG